MRLLELINYFGASIEKNNLWAAYYSICVLIIFLMSDEQVEFDVQVGQVVLPNPKYGEFHINLQGFNSLSMYKAIILEVRYHKRITSEQKNNKPRNAQEPIYLKHETLSYNLNSHSRATSCKTC